MGPILQEMTTSTILKTVPVKEKVKNSEILTSNTKTTGKVSQNLNHQKKASSLHKNVLSGQDKELLPRAEINGQQRNRTKHAKSPNTGTYKMLHTQFEADIRHPRSKPPPSEWEEKRHKLQHQSPCTGVEQNYAAREKKRRALSLPLAPHQVRLPENVRDLESLRLLAHKEDDTDSASDLSDSERLPVLPSPCTPPQLNLRAEIVESVDLHPHIPGPRTDSDGYNYPDFLPPPFSTWSLRQLATFLNMEGKRAPRPKPVGQLEVFLERLLQLEWHQIQTIQNENSQPTAKNIRSRSHASNYPQIASLSRPHTAPPSRLGSPKCMRQSQHPFPFPFPSSLGSPSSSCQLSRCLYCHVRYPLCNGSCCSYTYHRHSRLSPLLERKTSPSITHKRSNSESRASASDNNMARALYPVSPKSQKEQMTVGRNLQKASQELSVKSKKEPSDCKGHSGRVAKAESQRNPPVEEKSVLDKRVIASNKQDLCLAGKREQKEGPQREIGGRGSMAGVKRMVSDNNSIKGSRADRKLKNAYLSK